MKLAELGIDVDLMSLTPVKRSHSVCAQGGINSVNDVTRQQGDNEWLHFDDTVYGGDFLQHQPPVKEMCEWGPKIIDLMDRLGVPFNRTPRGISRPAPLRRHAVQTDGVRRRHHRPAVALRARRAGPPLGSRRQGEEVRVLGFPRAGARRQRRVPRAASAQDMVTMEIRAFPADAVIVASGGCGLIYGKSTMSMACTGSAASRCFQDGAKYANGEFIQVHPDGRAGRRQAAADERKRSRRRRPRVGAATAARPASAQADSRERTLLLSRGALSQVRQPRAARHRHARDLQRLHRRRA